MLFPRRMLRLTWFVPEERLAQGLETLAKTGVFHLIDHVFLGDRRDISGLKEAYRQNRHARMHILATRMLQQFPDSTLLHYRMGVLPGEVMGHIHAPGLFVLNDGLFLWAGKGEPPDTLTPYLFPARVQIPPPLPLSMDEKQWALFFATAERVGSVASWSVIDGWIPAGAEGRIRKLLNGEAVWMASAEESGLPLREVPVLYERPSWMEGFSLLMNNFGTTAYRELDPAFFLAAGFVLLFGMMFADLGQGLLLALLGWLLLLASGNRIGPSWARGRSARVVADVLIPIGLSAAFFGAMFGSCFAREDLIQPLWFHPMDQVMFYLGTTIGIGMAMIAGGLLLGMLNAIRGRRMSEIFWDKYGPVGLIFYTGLVALVISLFLQAPVLVPAGLLLCLGAVLIIMVRGFWTAASEAMVTRVFLGLLEGFDLVTKFSVQTISFARIAAFTLAHIGLSKAVVLIADILAGWPILPEVTMVLGNIFIIVLEGLLVSIQVVRLHFFEFFTKFVMGGGRPYVPLVMKEGVRW